MTASGQSRSALLAVALAIGLAVAVPAPPAAAQQVMAAVDRTLASTSDQIALTVTIRGSQSARPELPELPDFDVVPTGQQSHMQIVNGEMSVAVSYSYLLAPRRAGRFEIGPIQARIGDRTFASQPFEVRIVAGAAEPPRERELFITATVSEPEPYAGQQVIYTWRLYYRVRVADARLEPFDFPGLVSEDLGKGSELEATVGGQRFMVSEIKKALFPQEAGELTIEGPQLTCEVLRSDRRPSFFGRGRRETKVLRTPAVTLKVRPLPAAPSGFSGLIGDFALEAEASRRELEVGESTTLEITVSGSGNAQMISAPAMPPLDGFKVYKDKPSAAIERRRTGLSGRKTFETALVPLTAGELEVPPLSLVYFDPAAGSYRTLRTAPIPLSVRPGSGREELRLTEALGSANGKVAVRILADDILPIYKRLDAVEPQRPTGVAAGLWLAGLALPPVAFLGALAARRRRRRYDDDRGLRRRQGARKRALAALGQLGTVAGEERLEAASRLLRSYIGDKLGLEGAALTAVEVATELRRRGVDEALVTRTRSLLERLEAVRFGARAADPGDGVADELRAVIEELERSLGDPARFFRPLGRGIAVLMLLATGGAAAAPQSTSELDTEPAAGPADGGSVVFAADVDPGELFVLANGAYEAGDYARAVELYRRVIERGGDNGHLYYNLGNAYLRHGELGRAIAAYRRAEALLPRDQDVEANLAFARSSARTDLAPPQPRALERTLFFWHYALSRPELLRLTALANLLFWGLLAARLVRRRSEVLRWAVAAALVLLVASGASLAVHSLWPHRVAVVLAPEVEAYSGTGEDTVVRFRLLAGAEVEVVEASDGWLRIRLPDGEQGWIERRHTELVRL